MLIMDNILNVCMFTGGYNSKNIFKLVWCYYTFCCKEVSPPINSHQGYDTKAIRYAIYAIYAIYRPCYVLNAFFRPEAHN